ncbi:MAG: hypothetical protein K2R98_11040 [Gemmataceae bacterium]|nr:hypothetical protein [Gemmataceae bacterium]
MAKTVAIDGSLKYTHVHDRDGQEAVRADNMSDLTLRLLNRKPAISRRRVWQVRFGEIADRLVAAYGVPLLGNLDDPTQEIFYIVLSAKTTDSQYRRTYALLTAEFQSLSALADARVAKIVRCIVGGGLANKKARQVKLIASRLKAELGDDPTTGLRRMSAEDAFDFLTGLPGLGPKSALCVMMCSLNFDVFPVDVNVSRIAQRIGVVPRGLKHYDYTQTLPAVVPLGRSKELHVGLVVHGRTICLPRKPMCERCFLNDLCNFGKRRLRGKGDGRQRKRTRKTKGN